jgi:uracil DNA glycosylase
MKVIYYKEDSSFNLAVDYGKMIGNGWSRRLKEYLHSKDMQDTMYEVSKLYTNKHLAMFPAKDQIFASLGKMDLTEINVAIINCNPTFNYRSNGVAFSNTSKHRGDIDLQLSNLFDKINIYERRTSSAEDYTLDHWIEQSVFLFNVSLTGFTSYNQRSLWFGFSRAVIETISRCRQGLVFLFIGTEEQCKLYSEKVDQRKHTILRHDTLSYDALNEVNLEIDSIDGKDYRIKW